MGRVEARTGSLPVNDGFWSGPVYPPRLRDEACPWRRRDLFSAMASLRQLLARGSLLVLDAASSIIQVGWFRPGQPARWIRREEEAGTGLFGAIEELGGADAVAADQLAFCDGPGSILGIRTTAMALRTWQVLRPRPLYAYGSLALLAHGLDLPGTVIADARRESWHAYDRTRGLRRVPTTGLAGLAPLSHPGPFRHWSPLPAETSPVPYDVAALLAAASEADLFLPTEAPDAFLHEEPSYVTWTPQIHRTPVPTGNRGP